MKEKELYFAPDVQILTIQNEGVICESPYGEEGAAGGNAGNNNQGQY